jgi:nucleoside-diphosphate-sugar epimerase
MRNLTMAQHLASFLDGADCTHVVYTSSDAVYEGAANPIREDTPCCPPTLYGQMHLLREKMLASVLDPARCPLLVVRPCALFGAGDTHNSYGPNRFLRSALGEGRITLFGGGEEKRDHVYIHDFCRLLCLALARRSAGVLNVAAGQSISFRELAERIASLCEVPAVIEDRPRQTPITHRHFDVSERIRAFPAFHPTPLDQALAEMALQHSSAVSPSGARRNS